MFMAIRLRFDTSSLPQLSIVEEMLEPVQMDQGVRGTASIAIRSLGQPFRDVSAYKSRSAEAGLAFT